jgi:hypothetical protein
MSVILLRRMTRPPGRPGGASGSRAGAGAR